MRLDQLNRPRIKEALPAEAGIALTTVGVQDLEGRSAARWAGPVTGDDHLRSLADHVPAEPDPRSTGQLQPDAGRLADGRREASGARARTARHPSRWRLEHDEGDPGTARERRQPSEPIAESRLRPAAVSASGWPASGQAGRQVHHQQVHGATGEQRAGDRQALLGVGRGQDDEPLRLDPARHRLDRVERGREVQPGDDRAGRLRLGREPECERRPPARVIPAQREAHATRHATGAEDGIELAETGREDAIRISPGQRLGQIQGHGRQGPHDVAEPAAPAKAADLAGGRAQDSGRGRSPARSEGRERRGQVGRGSGHRRVSIEQMFE